jgi:hypothetical protein
MEFLAPWSLAGLALVPAIFLWGLLAPRGRPVVVGSLMLWRRALGGGPAGKPSARVRLRDPLLWLDAATILLIVLACAQPAARTTSPTDPVATVVIDRTASMAQETPGGKGERSRAAQALATPVLKAAGGAPLHVIFVPDESGGTSSETVPASDLLGRGGAWSPVLAQGDVWRVALAEAAKRTDLPVLVITGVGPTAELPANVFVLAPGGTSANVGLVRVAARIEGNRWWLLVSARVDAGAPGPCTLVVDGDGKTLATKPDFLAAGPSPAAGPGATGGVTAEAILPLSGPPPRRLTAELLAGADGKLTPPRDSFPPDDKAYLALEAERKVRILLVGKPDLALRRALAAREDTTVVEAPHAGRGPTPGTGLPDAGPPLGDTDLVIACAAAIPAGWKGPSASVLPPDVIGPVRPAQGQGAAEWKVGAENPLAGAFYLEPPRMGGVRQYTLAPAGQLLLGTSTVPLMATWETGKVRHLAVLFGFDEQTTDWPRRAGFPVFWSRAVDWLIPKDARPARLTTYLPFQVMPGRNLVAPAKIGFHEDKTGVFAVSFIGTPEAFQSGPSRDDSAGAIQALRQSIEAHRRATLAPLWPYLAIAALAALVARAWVAK